MAELSNSLKHFCDNIFDTCPTIGGMKINLKPEKNVLECIVYFTTEPVKKLDKSIKDCYPNTFTHLIKLNSYGLLNQEKEKRRLQRTFICKVCELYKVI
jgi:hypothetical protein